MRKFGNLSSLISKRKTNEIGYAIEKALLARAIRKYSRVVKGIWGMWWIVKQGRWAVG